MGVELVRVGRRKGSSPSPIPNEPRPALPTPRGCGGQWLFSAVTPALSMRPPDALPGLTQASARTQARMREPLPRPLASSSGESQAQRHVPAARGAGYSPAPPSLTFRNLFHLS